MKKAIENLKETKDKMINIFSEVNNKEIPSAIQRYHAQKRAPENEIPLNPCLDKKLSCFTVYESRLEALKKPNVLEELDALKVEPENLAKSGFFPLFDRNSGRYSYQCFACSGKLSNLKLGENVFMEHITYFPRCPMVYNQS